MNAKVRVEIAIRNSTYVANVLKHMLLSEMSSALWRFDPNLKLQIYEGEVDDVGCDIVLSLGSVTRHVQLKASYEKSTTSEVEIHTALANAVSGCVVWMFYDPATLRIGSYRFFGGSPKEPLQLTDFKVARRVTPNSKGVRPVRPKIRLVAKGVFRKAQTIQELLLFLFDVKAD